MNKLLKFLWVVIVSGLGGLAYAITANVMIAAGMLDSSAVGDAFGQEMTGKAAIVWMVAILAAIASVFIASRWRYVLLFAPLYAPSIFAVVFVAMNAVPE